MNFILFKHTKISLLLLIIILIVGCKSITYNEKDIDVARQKVLINQTLDIWHAAASHADFKTYFGLMDAASVFVGTDSAEVWNKQAFMAFAKPYFERGKAWQFKPLNRHIYFDKTNHDIVWFDETLNTWMGICRGSGVLVKKNRRWLIKHYVLSLTVPNNKIKAVIKAIK